MSARAAFFAAAGVATGLFLARILPNTLWVNVLALGAPLALLVYLQYLRRRRP